MVLPATGGYLRDSTAGGEQNTSGIHGAGTGLALGGNWNGGGVKVKMSTRQIVIAGLLSALTVALGASGWGLIPIPTPVGAATVMHIPVIIAGMLEGPLVGAFVGLLFSLFTIQFAPPWVVIPARLLIGPAAWLVYRSLHWSLSRLKLSTRWSSPVVAAAAAGLAGTAVNAGGTLFLAVQFGLFSAEVAWATVLSSSIAEALLAALICAVLIVPLRGVSPQAETRTIGR